MGAWGSGVYENDDAADFVSELSETADLSRVRSALARVLSSGDDYLEAPESSEGLAAADVVACLRGNPGAEGANDAGVTAWVQRVKLPVPDDVLTDARAVVVRVQREPSELLELWSEDDPAEWQAHLQALQARLQS